MTFPEIEQLSAHRPCTTVVLSKPYLASWVSVFGPACCCVVPSVMIAYHWIFDFMAVSCLLCALPPIPKTRRPRVEFNVRLKRTCD